MRPVDAPACRVPGRLPLGPASLPEERRSRQLAPGVVHHHLSRGFRSPDEGHLSEVARALPEGEARELARRLGPEARVTRVSTPADDRPGPEEPRFSVRVPGSGVDTAEDGLDTTGPWSVHVLDVDLAAFPGRLVPRLAADGVAGRGTVSSVAERHGALAGVNGGYFVELPDQGTVGEPAGVSVVDGHLLSEALGARAALILGDGSARVARVSTEVEVRAGDGSSREVEGVNRPPGVARSASQEAPGVAHDATLRLRDDLVLFTPEFGEPTPTGSGAEAVLDAEGRVVEVREGRGQAVPDEGRVLAGLGDGADWLLAHARPGERLEVSTRVLADGEPLALDQGVGVVNGGPTLVRDGEVSVPAWAEGFDRADDPTFHHHFGERRNGRTMAGTTADGHLLLVTVDGHQSEASIGLNFHEGARLMRALGATDAVNLDGGGSTTMVVGNEVVNIPSDAGGERAVGDSLLLVPEGLELKLEPALRADVQVRLAPLAVDTTLLRR